MSDRLHELAPGTVVVLVTFADLERAEQYRQRSGLAFPVLADPTRSAYRAYGLGRGSPFRVWGWRAARRYLQLIRRDGVRGLRAPTEDTLQLGGDFVVAPDGTLAWGHWSEGPDDRPAIDDLVAAAEAAAG